MLKQSLEDQIAYDTKSKEEEMAAKAATLEAKATAESDLAATEKDLADAQAALKESNEGCMTVAADHEASVAGRTQELAVLAEAEAALKNNTGGAMGQAYSFAQLGQAQAGTAADPANAEVVKAVK